MKDGSEEKMMPLFWLHWLHAPSLVSIGQSKLRLRILAKVAIRYASRYMPRDYDINHDTM